MQRERHEGNSGSIFALPDEGAVLIGGAEIDVDTADLVSVEDEELGISEVLAAFGDAVVGHKGLVTFDEDLFEFMPLDPFGVAPAADEIGRLVDPVIIGAGETEILRQRIFAPLKMSQTIAYQKDQNEVSNRAYGHSKEGNTWKETDQSPTSATLGDGGIYSSLTDLAKWDEALARHTLLSEKEMQPALTSAQLTNRVQATWPASSDRTEGTPVSYGFGWFLDPYRNHARMWHYGDTVGFHTYIQRFPADRLTIIILCNRTDLDPESLAAKVADLYLNAVH